MGAWMLLLAVVVVVVRCAWHGLQPVSTMFVECSQHSSRHADAWSHGGGSGRV